jgi:hypothetical protein
MMKKFDIKEANCRFAEHFYVHHLVQPDQICYKTKAELAHRDFFY